MKAVDQGTYPDRGLCRITIGRRSYDKITEAGVPFLRDDYARMGQVPPRPVCETDAAPTITDDDSHPTGE